MLKTTLKNHKKWVIQLYDLSKLFKNTNRGFAKFFSAHDYNPEFVKRVQSQNRIDISDPYSFWVIGSGPAGFYATKWLINTTESISVDMFESDPHPYGLIRNGVAPDHQAMKKIMYDYDEVFRNENVNFYGNITVGKDISIKE